MVFMNCPCGSGFPVRRVNGGVPWCTACQGTNRLHGKLPRREVDVPRDVITRQIKARRRIEAMEEMLDALC
jgi:hypothetical protein